MRTIIVATAIALVSSTAAFADEKPSAAELEKINATLKAWGCSGGTAEKETEGSGVFEVDDAKCPDGNQFDIKMDSKFGVTSMTRD